eukprot:236389_1
MMEPRKPKVSLSESLSFNTQSSAVRSAQSDWLIILCLIILGLVLVPSIIRPHHQCIPGYTQVSVDDSTIYPCGREDDPELQYPYTPSTVSTNMALLLEAIPWVLTFITNTLLLYCSYPALYSHRIALKNIEIMLRMLFFAITSTRVATNCIKLSVGRPRPNFYALMDDSLSKEDHRQARMSFPSGHASSAFAALFLLALNLYQAMNYAKMRFRQD